MMPGRTDVTRATDAAAIGKSDLDISAGRNEIAISTVVRQLNAICKSATLEFALSVGQCVINSVYAGDLSRFRSREPKKEATLRGIAMCPDLAMSPSALYRSLAMYELCERLGIRKWNHVSTSHLRLVLPLNEEEQSSLLRTAELRQWSVKRLDEEVATLRLSDVPERDRGGRRRNSRLRRALRRLDGSLGELMKLLGGTDDALAESSPESSREASDFLRRVVEICGRLEHRIAPTLPGAETTPPPPPSRS